jgi:hypothetical protein
MDLRALLRIEEKNVKVVNDFLLSEDNPLINNLLEVIDQFGGVDEINRKAREAGKLDDLMTRLIRSKSPFVEDLEWLKKAGEKGSFISIADYRKKILGEKSKSVVFGDSFAVTLEISALNFFPWLIEEAKQAIDRQELMPSRYIRVRNMKEQVEDGDVLTFAAGMQIIGASYVQTLDTKGTMLGVDGMPVNVHLGGPETITGYFGGVGVPNEYSMKWVEEVLYYYTNYGLKQVLNVNSGTVLLGYFLRKLGIDIEFKISVFLGNDNPYSILWTLMTGKLLSSADGSTPLIGFNLSNSVNNRTIELSAQVRRDFGFEDIVRIEHHITEAYRSIVREPYDRLTELVELADHVKNISAKHEGGVPSTEKTRQHPSDILDYFISKREIETKGLMQSLLRNYLDKHDAVNRTAKALTENGLSCVAARNLHR